MCYKFHSTTSSCNFFFSSFVNFAAAYLIEIKFATTRFLILTCRSVINRYHDFDITEQTETDYYLGTIKIKAQWLMGSCIIKVTCFRPLSQFLSCCLIAEHAIM